MKTEQYIQKNRAAIFDWSVITTSFLLGFIFPTIVDFISSKWFSYWMLGSFLLYTAGVALKHLPLSYRLTYSAKQIRPVPYIIFLVIGHWFIMLFVIIFSESAFRTIFGMAPLTKNDTLSGRLISIATILAALVTWLVYRSKTKRSSRKKYPLEKLFYIELVADFLLIVAVSIFSFAFWEKGAMAMLARASTETFSDVWFLFVFLSILFLFFYLPMRYLYFMEDREGGRNRRRLLYVFTFMLLRGLFEMLNL